MKVYLAGIMDSVIDTPEVMTGWRNQAKDYFAENHCAISVLDPCRRPHFADLTDEEVVALDLKDVENSDVLLADCRDHGKPTFGTPVEIFYMNRILRRPVIGWYDEMGYRERSIFQNVFVTRMLPSLEQAMDHIIEFYA